MSLDAVSRPAPRPGRLRAWARERAEVQLYRNGYALIASSGLTSALGLVFWLVAARSYSAVAVGVGSALISATTTIANLSHLNLKSALNRFLPSAGRASNRMVGRSYALAVVIAGLVSVAFVAGLPAWAPRLAFVRDRPVVALWFVLSTMAWTIFVLQDSVLTGIRQAVWVPAENLVYALIKLALLPLLVIGAPLLGTFVAWTAALPLIVVPVNLLLFRWLLPGHVRATREHEERVGLADVVRYVGGDYAAYLSVTATIGLLPLVVLAVLGARANACYFVCWSIAYGLYLIAGGMGMSMITEAVHDPASFARYRRQSLVETAKLVIPCVVVVVLAAPWLMGLLGPNYSSGVNLLRMLSLSAVPWIVFVTYTNAARVQRRMRVVVAAHVALCCLVLAIGLPLLRPLGLDGLGIGWLAAQTLLAVAILAGQLVHRPRAEMASGAVAGLSAARTRVRRLRFAGPQRRVLAELRGYSASPRWVRQRNLSVLNDVAVSVVGPRASEPEGVLKCAGRAAGEQSVRAHANALEQLRPVLDRDPIGALVPTVLASGVAAGHGYVLETYLPGRTIDSLLRQGTETEPLLVSATSSITALHDATARREPVDAALLRDLIEIPLAQLRPVVARRSRLKGANAALERLEAELRAALSGRALTVSWVHGDFSPGNVLVGDDGTVLGILDWERGRARGLPQLDLLQLLLATRTRLEARELGDVVQEMLHDPAWRPRERLVVDALERRDPSLPTRAALLLAWLDHVAANIEKSGRYASNRLWVRRNLDPVLAALLDGPAATDSGDAPTAVALRPAGGVASRLPRLRADSSRLALAAPLGTLGIALALWIVSLPRIHPRMMTDLGLISVLPTTFFVAVLVLSVGFVVVLHQRRLRAWALAAHALALVAFIHATPAIVYGTVRYEWTWKHIGIVDYLARHGGVDPAIRFQSVYHNWPGFFALNTLLTKVAGLPNAISLAIWGPVFNNVLFLGALLFLFSGLTRDRRVVWLACWLFLIANWVGQDYFSPQAFAYLLYLVLLGTIVRWLVPNRRSEPPGRAVALGLAAVLLAAIAASHALTSVMACIALTALVLVRVTDVRALPLVAAGFTVVWDLVFAWDFTSRDIGATLREVNLPWDTTSSTLSNVARLSPDQALVAHVARGLTVAVLLIGVIGAARQWRARKLNRAAAVLAVAPFALFATGNYDGEILFRILLFSVPFFAFFGAHALIWRRRRTVSLVLTATVSTLMLGGFLVSYYGKERANYFTPGEVAAARYVDTHAPSRTLLIDGTNNYPYAFKNYERFVYVSIADEPPASRDRVLANPAAVLSDWMHSGSYQSAYLIITRSQKIDAEANGAMPGGSLDAIEHALIASPRFRVAYRNRDAIVFSRATANGARSGP